MTAIKSLFAFLTTLFSACDDLAHGFKAVSEYTKEGAEAFRNEARLERADQLAELSKQLEARGL